MSHRPIDTLFEPDDRTNYGDLSENLARHEEIDRSDTCPNCGRAFVPMGLHIVDGGALVAVRLVCRTPNESVTTSIYDATVEAPYFEQTIED